MDSSINRSAHLLVVGGVLFVLCCQNRESNGEEGADPCNDPVQLSIKNPEALAGDPDYLAQLTIDELDELGENGERSVSTIIKAIFADISAYKEELTPAAKFDPACVGILGRPKEAEGIEPLTLDSVSVTTPSLGERSLERAGIRPGETVHVGSSSSR